MHSQNSTKTTKDSKRLSQLISTLISTLITIVTLTYLASIPLGKIKKESKLEPVDVGVLMVLLIFNSRIIERVTTFKFGKDGFEANVEQAKVEVKKDIDEQNDIDFEAMKLMDLQVSDATPLPQSKLDNLRENILKASPTALEYIYQRVKDLRHDVSKENRQHQSQSQDIIKGRVERTIPIFQALIESEYGKESHRYYAQLGYALKDYALEDKDDLKTDALEKARSSLNKAIKLWQERNSHATNLPPLYCFNWAECDAKLLEPSVLRLEEIQWRIDSAALCRTNYNGKLIEIKDKLEKKYGKPFLKAPIASKNPDISCHNANMLVL